MGKTKYGRRKGSNGIPIVLASDAIRLLENPEMQRCLVGEQRRLAERMVRIFRHAMSDQVDGRVSLTEEQVQVLLAGFLSTQDWFLTLLRDELDDDEQL